MAEFLSTPSSQRATPGTGSASSTCRISIHALFAEGDMVISSAVRRWPYFYPRPLRRGRPVS